MILRGNDGLYYDVDLDGNVKGPLVMRNSHVMAPISPPGYAESIMARLPAADIVGFRPDSPGVVPGGESPTRTDQGDSPLAPTIRPLQGLQPNQRGNGIVLNTLLPPFVLNPSQPQVVAEARAKGDDAETINITLGLGFAGGPPSLVFDFSSDVKALVEWGVGGATFSMTCDWLLGTTFPVTANFVRVSAICPSNLGFGAGALPFQLGVTFGYGAGRCDPQLSQVLATLAAGAVSTFIPIPNFAKEFAIATTAAAGVPLEIRQTNIGTTFARHNYTTIGNDGFQNTRSFPVVAGARNLVVTNNSAVATTVRGIFRLGL